MKGSVCDLKHNEIHTHILSLTHLCFLRPSYAEDWRLEILASWMSFSSIICSVICAHGDGFTVWIHQIVWVACKYTFLRRMLFNQKWKETDAAAEFIILLWLLSIWPWLEIFVSLLLRNCCYYVFRLWTFGVLYTALHFSLQLRLPCLQASSLLTHLWDTKSPRGE